MTKGFAGGKGDFAVTLSSIFQYEVVKLPMTIAPFFSNKLGATLGILPFSTEMCLSNLYRQHFVS